MMGKHVRCPAALQVEASSAFRGVGLVKLMGRSSGFIAMQASMASGESVRSMPAGLTHLTSCPSSMRHI